MCNLAPLQHCRLTLQTDTDDTLSLSVILPEGSQTAPRSLTRLHRELLRQQKRVAGSNRNES